MFIVGYELGDEVDLCLSDVSHIFGSSEVVSLARRYVARLDMYAAFYCHRSLILLVTIRSLFARFRLGVLRGEAHKRSAERSLCPTTTPV